MSGIDLIVYGMLLAFTMIGTTEFVIGLLLLAIIITAFSIASFDRLSFSKSSVIISAIDCISLFFF